MSTKKSVKIFLKDEVKRFKIDSFEEFTTKLSSLAGLEMDGLRWFYLDEEHDWVSFKTEEEFDEACQCHLRPLMKIQAREEDEKPVQCPWFQKQQGRQQMNVQKNQQPFHQVKHQQKVSNLKNRIQKLQAANKRKNENHQRKIEKFQSRIKQLTEKLKSQREMGENQKEKLKRKLDNQREKLKTATEKMKGNMVFKQEKLQFQVEKLQSKLHKTQEKFQSREEKQKWKQQKQMEKQQKKLEKFERKQQKHQKKMEKKLEKAKRFSEPEEEEEQVDEDVGIVDQLPQYIPLPPVTKPVTEEEEKNLKLLEAMCLVDREENLKILRENENDIQAALKVLLKE